MSNSNKKLDLPAMPFYIGDWKKDPAVQMLNREDKMIWLEMIFLMWESKERGFLTVNGKPITTEMLSVALNLDNQNLSKRLSSYEDLGLYSKRESDGAIYSRRIVKIVELSEKRKNAGNLGGNPNLLKQGLNKKKAKGLPNTENENENEIEDEKEKKRKADFEKFWDLYEKKKGDKDKVFKKFNELTTIETKKIFETLPEYVASTPDKQFRKDPMTYLNNKAWDDEIIKPISEMKPDYPVDSSGNRIYSAEEYRDCFGELAENE